MSALPPKSVGIDVRLVPSTDIHIRDHTRDVDGLTLLTKRANWKVVSCRNQ